MLNTIAGQVRSPVAALLSLLHCQPYMVALLWFRFRLIHIPFRKNDPVQIPVFTKLAFVVSRAFYLTQRRQRLNASHHLPAKVGEARCGRSDACGCYAAFWLMQPMITHFRLQGVNRTSDDRTSGNRAIRKEMTANPRLSDQVDPMSDD